VRSVARLLRRQLRGKPNGNAILVLIYLR
jgi:hypothetical protein